MENIMVERMEHLISDFTKTKFGQTCVFCLSCFYGLLMGVIILCLVL